MKTNDLISLGALGVLGYIAYQKWGKPQTPVDFGLNNPNDSSWGDPQSAPPAAEKPSTGITFVDAILSGAGA